jgi:hypothetical protein
MASPRFSLLKAATIQDKRAPSVTSGSKAPGVSLGHYQENLKSRSQSSQTKEHSAYVPNERHSKESLLLMSYAPRIASSRIHHSEQYHADNKLAVDEATERVLNFQSSRVCALIDYSYFNPIVTK